MAKFTEEELDALSPEEREAIEGDTGEEKTPEELLAEQEGEALRQAKIEGAGDATRVIDKKTATEKSPEEIEAEEALAAAEAAEAASTKAAAEATAALAEAEALKAASASLVKTEETDDTTGDDAKKLTPVIPPKSEPAFVLEVQGKHGTIEEIEAKLVELDTKFEDGDITLAAYNKERASFVEAITEQKMFSTINAQVMKAAAEKSWKDAQTNFFNDHPEYYTERIKNVAFVDAVNRFLATDESKKMTDAQIFDHAMKECDTVFYPDGRRSKTKDDPKVVDLEEKRTAAAEAEKKRVLDEAKKLEAERAAGVKTLAKVPVAEGNVGDEKFDAIDKLTGLAYENAVARMSDQERAAYAARV